MSYAHIRNLYQDTTVLKFRQCYCLEKLDGTSAHIAWKRDGSPTDENYDKLEPQFNIFSGGASHETFAKLFDKEALTAKYKELWPDMPDVIIFGEAYGGKMQGMKDTYGPNLKFCVFDVKIGNTWLSVPDAADVANKLGLEFVDCELVDATIEEVNRLRDKPSVQAARNGMNGKDKFGFCPPVREGIVIRPPFEVRLNNGERVCAKHKRAEFSETMTPREVDPAKLKRLEEAKAIANEWCTPMRLEHVLQKLPEATGMEHTGMVIRAMIDDVLRESAGEIVDSEGARKEIGKVAALMWKKRISKI